METPPVVMLWDIDGTLLTTNRAGIPAFEDAVREVLGRSADLRSLPTAGLTDPAIARQILHSFGLAPDPVAEKAILDVYTRQLPERLSQGRGTVMPGVVEILELVSTLDNVVSALLTGNMRAGADAKLRWCGLSAYFSTGGFGDDSLNRAEIAAAALVRVDELAGPIDRERVYVIGDTPYDIACAHAVGAHAIGVATGTYLIDELAACGPWWVLPTLPEAHVFAEHLQLRMPAPR